MTKWFCGLALLVFCELLFVHSANALVFGQIDDFEDGTLMGWSNGGTLTNISSGGPAGANDHYIQLTADGAGSNGRLTTFNLQQWLGDYIGQGVTTIEIDLRNEGATSLSIRLAFKSQNLPNAPGYLSLPMLLPVGSGWQHFSVSLASANLIAIGGPAAYNTFFTSGIGDVRIINEVGATNLNGDFIVGQLGFDNIHAVPEPAATVLVASGVIALAFMRLRSRRSVR